MALFLYGRGLLSADQLMKPRDENLFHIAAKMQWNSLFHQLTLPTKEGKFQVSNQDVSLDEKQEYPFESAMESAGGQFDSPVKKYIMLKDKIGNTPLHYACESGNIEIVNFILSYTDRNLLINLKNIDQQTVNSPF